MKAEEVAFEAIYGMHKREFSRDTFRVISKDAGEMGQSIRKLLGAITTAVEADRAAQETVYAARHATRNSSP